jgi:ACR3 family arsenite efflux pump ArsB
MINMRAQPGGKEAQAIGASSVVTTVGVNWLVKPFSMALLGWLFIAHLFRPLLPADQIDGYIAGLILGGCSLHGHGVRLVEPCGRRAAFHAVTGRAQ